MNRFRYQLTVVAVSLLTTAGMTAPTGVGPRADGVSAERKNPGVTRTVTLRALRLAQGRYGGQTVEVTGTVVGRISTGAKTTYLVRDGSVSEYLEAEKPLSEMITGRRVRMRIRIPEGPSSLSRMRILKATPAPASPPPTRTAASPKPAAAGLSPGAAVSVGAGNTQRAGPVASPQSQPEKKAGVKPVTLTRGAGVDSRIAQLRPAYAETIRRFNKKLPKEYAAWIAELILRFGFQHQVDPRLVMAVIAAESNFKLTATSPKGAMGLGQLMPATAAGLGVRNPYDPEQNLAAAVRIIRANLDRYRKYGDKQFALALAAYNAGKGAVAKYGGVPPYRETINYIWKVYRIYRALAPELFR